LRGSRVGRLKFFWYLESNRLLSTFQHGFRKGRNTTQDLFDLQSQINEIPHSKSCLFFIFFSLQNAFPRVWKHYICSKLHEIGICSFLPNILQGFLIDRTLIIQIQRTYFYRHTIQNGVPQGEVLSALLFLMAINVITECVHFPLT